MNARMRSSFPVCSAAVLVFAAASLFALTNSATAAITGVSASNSASASAGYEYLTYDGWGWPTLFTYYPSPVTDSNNAIDTLAEVFAGYSTYFHGNSNAYVVTDMSSHIAAMGSAVSREDMSFGSGTTKEWADASALSTVTFTLTEASTATLSLRAYAETVVQGSTGSSTAGAVAKLYNASTNTSYELNASSSDGSAIQSYELTLPQLTLAAGEYTLSYSSGNVAGYTSKPGGSSTYQRSSGHAYLFSIQAITQPATVTPEPASLFAWSALGLIGLCARSQRRDYQQ